MRTKSWFITNDLNLLLILDIRHIGPSRSFGDGCPLGKTKNIHGDCVSDEDEEYEEYEESEDNEYEDYHIVIDT